MDIREHGSGNLGGTNTFRVLGKTAGLTVTILDILKGTVAALLPLFPIFDSASSPSAYSRNYCGCRSYVSRLRSFQRWQSCCDIWRCVACLQMASFHYCARNIFHRFEINENGITYHQ